MTDESAERLAFRQEVTAFLEESLGSVFRVPEDGPWRFALDFSRKVSQRGWVGSWWPKEYGGEEGPYWKQLILLEEMALWDAPRGPLYISWDRIAWTLLILGTDEQKLQHLPAIQRVDEVWCQAFTEPDSGSDLASLKTRAVRDGSSFRVTGQKTFNSYANHATHALLVARTDVSGPKHHGIALFTVDLSLPGVTVKPFEDMNGDLGHFNEIWFDDVILDESALIGPEHDGWRALRATLDSERAGVAITRLGYARRALAALAEAWPSLPEHRRISSGVRSTIADVEVQIELTRLFAYQVAAEQEKGNIPEVESSVAKMFACETQQRAFGAVYSVWPEAMQMLDRPLGSMPAGFFATHLIDAVSATIAGGTTEVQLNIIAKHALGLRNA